MFVIGTAAALSVVNVYGMFHYFSVLKEEYPTADTGQGFSDLLYSILPVMAVVMVIVLVIAFIIAKHMSDKVMKPIIELDLDRPENVYEELKPFLDRVETEKNIKAEAEKMRREFSANVSHELKTPLTTISGYAQMMNNGMARAEDYTAFAQKIEKESSRLLLLINDIIKLSNLDENGEIEKEEVDLPLLLQECTESLMDAAREKGVKVYFASTNAKILGSYTMVYEMVYNIIDNAIKYNRENGSVSVFAGEYPDRVELSVKDTGIGIAPKEQERIFERFYRVDKSHSKTVGGTGLGLSIVKHAAKWHNAQISVKSELGKGTTMKTAFPKIN